MSRREIAAAGLDEAFRALKAELAIPGEHPPEAVAEAERVAKERAPTEAPLDIDFVTIDPPGARDLDQAMHLSRDGGGFIVRYAIADVAHWVEPGGAIDTAAWERGVTYYAPDAAVPLHPPVLATGAASLLPDQPTPAIVWTLRLDADGRLKETALARACVRSRAQLTYEDEPPELLGVIGPLRERIEAERGGVSLPLPEQEVHDGALAYRAPLATEGWNAQLSLLTGIAAADLMLGARVGIVRTLPPADPRALERLRLAAVALGVEWNPDYPAFIRSLDPADPKHAAVLHDATSVMRGAGYQAFDGTRPDQDRHSAIADEYAHVTAPLRRLADRYALECALAAFDGDRPPDWVTARLPELPDAMRKADSRAGSLERAAVDLVEAVVLKDRIGETFEAVVIDDGLVQLTDPAVRAKCDGDPKVGERVTVRLVTADPESRQVRFTAA